MFVTLRVQYNDQYTTHIMSNEYNDLTMILVVTTCHNRKTHVFMQCVPLVDQFAVLQAEALVGSSASPMTP